MSKFVPTKSIKLNGTNEYFTCGTGLNVGTDGAGTDQPFSICAWVNFSDATSRGILSKRSVWEFALNPSDQLVCNLYTSGVIYIGRTSAALTSLQNTWVHVAMTYSGSEANSGVKLYVNGYQADTADSSAGVYTGMPSNSTTVTMGALDASLRWFGGYLGRVTIYNKELTLAEVKEEVNLKDLNWFSAKGNIVSSWEPESFDGTTLKDRKGGNNGTSVNMDSTNVVIGTNSPRRHQAVKDRETPAGKFGGFAWDFDGAAEYISIPDAANLSFGNSTVDSAFSIRALVRIDNLTDFKTVIGKWNYSTASEYIFQIGTSGDLRFFLNDQSAAVSPYCLSGSNVIVPGSFYDIVITYDGTGGATAANGIVMYVNGASISCTPTNNASYVAMENTSADVYIGKQQGGTAYYFDGKISEVLLYNKALSATEVSQTFNNGQPRDELKTNLSGNIISYWRAYNSTNTASGVLDQVGSNHGTMTNMENADLAGADRNYPVKIYDNTNKASFNFDGSNEYGMKSSFSVNGYTLCTINMWVIKGNTAGYVFSMPDVSSGTNGIDFYNSGTNLWGYVKGSAGGSLLQNGVAFDSKWHMITLVYDGANFTSYIDAKSPFSLAKTGSVLFTVGICSSG